MNILHITPVYEPAWIYGGVVRAVSQLCRELVNLGINITVYTTNANGLNRYSINPDEEIQLGGVKVFRFPVVANTNYFYSPILSQFLAKNIMNFDLVHIASIWNYPGLPSVLYAKKFSIPYIFSAHGSLISENYPGTRIKNIKKWLYYQFFLKNGFRDAAAIHYTANMERIESEKLLKMRVPSFIVPNGIDTNEFDQLPSRSSSKEFFDKLNPESKVVSYLGRLHPRKALDVLVHGFKLALSRNENLELLLAGPDGGHEQYLRSLVKSLGIENKVHFLGLLDPEKRRMFFSFTDLFILAGYSGENFGVSAVEAMASGIPVIVSGHVCIYPDIVKNGAGIQVQVSKDEISEAIIKIFSDPELIKEMGEAAYRTARKFYEKTRTSQLMMLAYKDILLGKRSSECNWSN